MRTIVYVDGYNLYYSVLTKSPHKWLDLVQLFEEHLLRNILLPGADKPAAFRLTKIKFFTAPILGRMASDPDSESRQARYHRALKAGSGGRVETIKGFHTLATTTGIPVDPESNQSTGEKLKVCVMEEKQTDVSIGLHMYRDAVRGNCDCSVLCSNDSDLEPAMRMLRQDFPNLCLGLVLPRKAGNPDARRSARLEYLAHWVRHQIRESELERCQFPPSLLDHRNRTIKRPDVW